MIFYNTRSIFQSALIALNTWLDNNLIVITDAISVRNLDEALMAWFSNPFCTVSHNYNATI